MWRFGYSVSYSCFALNYLVRSCGQSSQAGFFISPASPFPASLRIKLCFCLEMSERSLLCGDEASSCWITTQITEGWYQFIAVWSGKGINSGFWLYGVSLVVKPFVWNFMVHCLGNVVIEILPDPMCRRSDVRSIRPKRRSYRLLVTDTTLHNGYVRKQTDLLEQWGVPVGSDVQNGQWVPPPREICAIRVSMPGWIDSSRVLTR